MTITFGMEPQQEALLAETAKVRGISTESLVREAVDKMLFDAARLTAKTDHRTVLEIFEDGMNDIPLEEYEKLPIDGASEHDHYLYGSPKRNG
jgi:hypothetical protein